MNRGGWPSTSSAVLRKTRRCAALEREPGHWAPARSSPTTPPGVLALLQMAGSRCVTDAPSSATYERVLAQARLAAADGEPSCARSSAADDRVPARARLAAAG